MVLIYCGSCVRRNVIASLGKSPMDVLRKILLMVLIEFVTNNQGGSKGRILKWAITMWTAMQQAKDLDEVSNTGISKVEINFIAIMTQQLRQFVPGWTKMPDKFSARWLELSKNDPKPYSVNV